MKLIGFLPSRFNMLKPVIRPAPVTRDWMDATPESFAYRCLPLNIANTHGWEILNPATFHATWDGGVGLDAITVESEAPPFLLADSHFGSGVLTFRIGALFRTDPGINLWVSGPVNRFKDGIAALTGVVETDWSPYTFTMNWKFTRPGVTVTFEKGEPICFFFPVKRGLVEEMEPILCELKGEPDTQEEYKIWTQARNQFNKDLCVEGSEAQKQKWQKYYYHGHHINGKQTANHQIKIRPKPFVERDETQSVESTAEKILAARNRTVEGNGRKVTGQ